MTVFPIKVHKAIFITTLRAFMGESVVLTSLDKRLFFDK